MIDLRYTLQGKSIGDVSCIGRFCPESGTGSDAGAIPLETMFTSLFGFLTIVGGLSFLVYFIVGAIKWLTAGGEAGKVEEAKKSMTNALIGMIIIVAAYSVAYIVGQVLGFDLLNPSEMLKNIFPAQNNNQQI